MARSLRLWPCALLALFLWAPWRAAPVRAAAGSLVALAGTPHLWVADDAGVLHWAGDTRALAGLPVRWDTRRDLTAAELEALPRGDPWLSAGLLKDGDPISLVKWETDQERPALLHIRSLADVELFGIDAGNYGRLVLTPEEWEQRHGLAVRDLPRGELAPAVVSPTPAPTATRAVPTAAPPAPRSNRNGGGSEPPAPGATAVHAATPVPSATATAATATVPTAIPVPEVVFILAGQSNLLGTTDNPPQPALPLARLTAPGQPWAAFPAQTRGPAVFVAAGFAAKLQGRTVGLLQCAAGGATLWDWRPRPVEANMLHTRCVTRARQAQAAGSTIAGLLWYQGESDALDPATQPPTAAQTVDQWAATFGALVAAFRADLGLPELPVALAQMASTGAPVRYPNWAAVQQQQALAAQQIPRSVLVPLGDMDASYRVDEVHLSTAGYELAGNRFVTYLWQRFPVAGVGS